MMRIMFSRVTRLKRGNNKYELIKGIVLGSSNRKLK